MGLFDGLGQGLAQVGVGVSRGELAATTNQEKLLQLKQQQDYRNSLLTANTAYRAGSLGLRQQGMQDRLIMPYIHALADPEQNAYFERNPTIHAHYLSIVQGHMPPEHGVGYDAGTGTLNVGGKTYGGDTTPGGTETPAETAAPNQSADYQSAETDKHHEARIRTGQQGQHVTDQGNFYGALGKHYENTDAIAGTRENANLANQQFDRELKLAQAKLQAGHMTFEEQDQVWSRLLSMAGQAARSGGNPGAVLKPFLFNHGAMGMTTPNEVAIKGYLSANGFSPGEIAAVIGGTNAGGGAQFSGGGAPPAPGGGPAAAATGGPPVLPAAGGATLAGAESFAGGQGYRVTSTTGGEHNPGSLHYQGRALDVSVRGKSPDEVKQFIAAAQQQGYGVRDERARPAGQAVWGGPHIHLEWGPNTKPNAAQALGFPEPPGGGAPRATPGQTAADLGVNTPGTAPGVKSPFQTGTFEDEIFGIYTGRHGRPVPAQQIIDQFRGNPQLQKAAARVLDAANGQQREGLFAGMPVQGTNGAEWPNVPDLGSGQVHVPGASIFGRPGTTPVTLQGGFGKPGGPGASGPGASGPGAGAAIPVEMPPVVASARPGKGKPAPILGTPPANPMELLPPDFRQGPVEHGATPRPTSYLDLGPWNAGSDSGGGGFVAQPGSVPGPYVPEQHLGKGPKAKPGYRLGQEDTRLSKTIQGLMDQRGPNMMAGPAKGGAAEAVSAGPGPTISAAGLPAVTKNIQSELKQYRTLLYAPAVEKLLKSRGITDPAQQQSIYRWTTAEVLPRLRKQNPSLGDKALRASLYGALNKALPR